MAKSAAKSAASSPNKSVAGKVDTSSRHHVDEKPSKNASTSVSADKSLKSLESTTSNAKSTTRKRKSSLLDIDKSQLEAKVSVEAKVEPKPSVISSPSSQSSKSQSIGSTKNKSSIENRPTVAEESSEPCKFSPSKREANERLRSPDAKLQLPVQVPQQSQLEQEMSERKAEHHQATTPTTGGSSKSKLSDALDKLFCKRQEKEQQQQQKQLQKAGKQSRLSHTMEEHKSPIDMDIEPKEPTECDEIIDVVKENRSKYAGRNDGQNQSLANVNETTIKLDETLDETDEQLRPSSTNKYEQEQFVNNMPKPPTPKSSMIFSPPPTSLTIDKREASIFDFADNFPIPNDSSVSLLSFNSENLFKEDSAKETMDLVANLRQNIKKGGKGDDCSRTKAEPLANQVPVAENEISPDSTTIDTSNKSGAIDNNKSAKSLDTKAKAPLQQQPTLVIDLDQENSGDESKPLPSEVLVNATKSGHKDSNWMPNTLPMEKDRANLMNVMQPAAPMQLQTEVEQIASKMSNVIPTPADMLAETDNQNLNAFHMQPYPCNAYNGNKEASFDRQSIQLQVRLKNKCKIFMHIVSFENKNSDNNF